MKKVLSILMVAILVFSLAACGSKGYTDGSYTATAAGNNGDVAVDVVVAGGKITAVTLGEHAETEGIYELAVAGVIPAIIEKQGVKGVDTVAGATVTSQAIIAAVTEALKGASK